MGEPGNKFNVHSTSALPEETTKSTIEKKYISILKSIVLNINLFDLLNKRFFVNIMPFGKGFF